VLKGCLDKELVGGTTEPWSFGEKFVTVIDKTSTAQAFHQLSFSALEM
jgi:hypothetical protein